jgi:hypothetical protein
LAVLNSRTEPKEKARRFYIIFAVTILLAALVVGVIAYELSSVDQTNDQAKYGPGPIDIEVTTDKPFYRLGELINFTIYVNNPQDWPVPSPEAVSYKIREDDHVVSDTSMNADYPPGTIDTFPAHSRTSSFYLWNSGSVPSGNYTLTVTYYGLVDYGEGGNCTFEIR